MLKNKIQNLISLIEGTEIEEIEVSSFWGAQKVRLSKSNKTSIPPSVSYVPPKAETEKSEEPITIKKVEPLGTNIEKNNEDNLEEAKEDIAQDLNIHELKAPLVGTYYSSSKPSSPPFINIGDKVKKGDTICIIEAMKIFNEIESDASGVVTELCVENGNPVEFDQTIIKISID
jgi:acetyl-CoA carboxylase biotin carboxyl carrier protein